MGPTKEQVLRLILIAMYNNVLDNLPEDVKDYANRKKLYLRTIKIERWFDEDGNQIFSNLISLSKKDGKIVDQLDEEYLKELRAEADKINAETNNI